MAKVDPKVVNVWTARTVPGVLIGVVGYATYVFVARLCVGYLLNGHDRRAGTVTALLTVYFLLMLGMATANFRLLYIVLFDTGFVPLGRPAVEHEKGEKRQRRVGARDDGLGGREFKEPETFNRTAVNWHMDGDAPGLEEFYTRDVFVCEMDGKPKWCTECACWKPDRAHHCSDVGRCVRKMDHFCPWVGGVVGENSFKFFIQFVFYTAVYCSFLLAVTANYLHEQLTTEDFTYDPNFAAIIGLATFFGLFTFGMTCSASNFALRNLTTIEHLNHRTKVWQLAVFIPDRQKAPTMGVTGIPFPTVTYPLPLPIGTEKPNESPAPSDTASEQPLTASINQMDLPHHAERDARAKRTFAILRMEPGQSPWDLGAAENWKAVMGTNVLDWFLPIRRSPLCNHENTISQFQLGKAFDKLVADNGVIHSSNGHRSSSRRRKSRRHSHQGSTSHGQNEKQEGSQQPP